MSHKFMIMEFTEEERNLLMQVLNETLFKGAIIEMVLGLKKKLQAEPEIAKK